LKLSYREFGEGDDVLVILHGLLGSSQNWQRAAKELAKQYRVLAVDQRNHGDSPHTETHTIADLREDTKDFLDQHQLERVHLLGHSMGGQAAMEFAYQYPERLNKLIIEDLAPHAYEESATADILQAMSSVPLAKMNSRQQVDDYLSDKIPSSTTRQFLLTNLDRKDDNTFEWQVNLSALKSYREEMASYQPSPNARYEGETLFIGGGRSEYHLDRDRDLILQYFPNSHLEIVRESGHWIHFEATDEFVRLVVRFVEQGLAAF